MKTNAPQNKAIEVEAVSIIEDLRLAPVWLRTFVTFLGSALVAYFAFFGPLAILNIWRSSLLSLTQIGIVTAVLVLQSAIGWAVKLKPIVGAAIFGSVWLASLSIVVIKASSPSDLYQLPLILSFPVVTSVLNGICLSYLSNRLEIPTRRGHAL
jgi:hypothetical protein